MGNKRDTSHITQQLSANLITGTASHKLAQSSVLTALQHIIADEYAATAIGEATSLGYSRGVGHPEWHNSFTPADIRTFAKNLAGTFAAVGATIALIYQQKIVKTREIGDAFEPTLHQILRYQGLTRSQQLILMLFANLTWNVGLPFDRKKTLKDNNIFAVLKDSAAMIDLFQIIAASKALLGFLSRYGLTLPADIFPIEYVHSGDFVDPEILGKAPTLSRVYDMVRDEDVMLKIANTCNKVYTIGEDLLSPYTPFGKDDHIAFGSNIAQTHAFIAAITLLAYLEDIVDPIEIDRNFERLGRRIMLWELAEYEALLMTLLVNIAWNARLGFVTLIDDDDDPDTLVTVARDSATQPTRLSEAQLHPVLDKHHHMKQRRQLMAGAFAVWREMKFEIPEGFKIT